VILQQPVFAQEKNSYRQQEIEQYAECYCYEMMPAGEVVYIPNGCVDLLWNGKRKELYCLPDSGQIKTLELTGEKLFGIHISALYQCDYEVEEVVEWMEQLEAVSGFEERAKQCSRQLVKKIQIKSAHPLVCHGVKQIVETKGITAVEGIAAEFGYTPRQLERLFYRYFSCGPKRLCQFVRLCYAVTRMLEAPEQSFAMTAEQLGYADQSHFHREFKRFTGMTPKQFALRYCERR
jgi:AraC-like DNA-binding protein